MLKAQINHGTFHFLDENFSLTNLVPCLQTEQQVGYLTDPMEAYKLQSLRPFSPTSTRMTAFAEMETFRVQQHRWIPFATIDQTMVSEGGAPSFNQQINLEEEQVAYLISNNYLQLSLNAHWPVNTLKCRESP